MLKLNRLYSEPEKFEPIEFRGGFNLILGETNESDEKTNGVGKSIAIEFINFALLKRHKDSRVSRIPETAFSYETDICLDFSIDGYQITSRRNIQEQDSPTLVIDGKERRYAKLEDAVDHLSSLLFSSAAASNPPSFRAIMGPLIRDEGSEFKSITQCYETTKRIPPDYKPHLYLFHIDSTPYEAAKRLQKEIDDVSKARKKMAESILEITGKNVADSKSDLNELEGQVRRVQADIENLENTEGYEAVKSEIIDIETRLEGVRSQQAVLRTELSKLSLFEGNNYIDEQEVAELYNQFKEGLGDLIRRDIEEVTAFKLKIDTFQRTIINTRKSEVEAELQTFSKEVTALSSSLREKLELLDQDGLLVSLKQTISVHEKKIEEFSALSAFINQHAEYDKQYSDKKRERDGRIYELQSYVQERANLLGDFEKTLLDVHEYVIGNRISSFGIEVSKRKEVLDFELRVHSDGSHSINREKVFMYDYSLLTNEQTQLHHPGLLIHDNIFDVDQVTLIRSMNYIVENLEALAEQQYVLTINSDKFGSDDLEKLNFALSDYEIAAFTRSKKFLGLQYQEMTG